MALAHSHKHITRLEITALTPMRIVRHADRLGPGGYQAPKQLCPRWCSFVPSPVPRSDGQRVISHC